MTIFANGMYDSTACRTFTNFVMTGYYGRLRIDAGLTDLLQGGLFLDKMRLIYLQMPCFTKEADECENHFERWIYILKNMEILERMSKAGRLCIIMVVGWNTMVVMIS